MTFKYLADHPGKRSIVLFRNHFKVSLHALGYANADIFSLLFGYLVFHGYTMSYIFIDLKVYLVYLFYMSNFQTEKSPFTNETNLIDTLDHVGHVLALLSHLEMKSGFSPQTNAGLHRLHSKLARSVLYVKQQLTRQDFNTQAR